MARGRDKDGKKGLGPEDSSLWNAYASDITPLEGAAFADMSAARPPEIKKPAQKQGAGKTLPSSRDAQPPQLDGRTDSKLKRGKMEIEGRIDLHGMTQAQAHEALNDFILHAYHAGKRCVLAITGKGGRGKADGSTGVLKEKFPQWVGMPPLCHVVLKIYPATARDGGSGAWYVYLKRARNKD